MTDKPVAWAVLVNGEVRALCVSEDTSKRLEQEVIGSMVMIEGSPCHNDGTEADVEVAPLVIAQSNAQYLTDEELAAIAGAADLLIGSKPGATLRKLLERLHT
jgi:hypothetical protein